MLFFNIGYAPGNVRSVFMRRTRIEDRSIRKPNTVDFWRGFALLEIVINHIPDNGFWRVTHRQFSWSDSAELFVFLAGWSISRRMNARHETWRELLSFCAGRFGKIYLGHVATTLIVMSLYLAFARVMHDPDLLYVNEAGLAATSPRAFLRGVFMLTEQIRFVDILPLYAILTLALPLLFILNRKPAIAMLSISAALYALALIFRVDLPMWPEPGRWFFNPVAWQSIFIAGFMIGKERDTTTKLLARAPFLLPAAAAIVLVAAVSMVAGWTPGGEGQMDGVAYYFFDKSSLGLLRLAQFLALALVVSRVTFLIPRFAPPAWRLFSFLGRNALAVFCAGCLISAIGQIAHHVGFHGVVFDSAFMVATMALLCLVAKVREKARAPRRPRQPMVIPVPADQPLPAMR
jgi:hypothetical protein